MLRLVCGFFELGHNAEVTRVAHQIEGSETSYYVGETHKTRLKSHFSRHIVGYKGRYCQPVGCCMQLLFGKMYFAPIHVFVSSELNLLVDGGLGRNHYVSEAAKGAFGGRKTRAAQRDMRGPSHRRLREF